MIKCDYVLIAVPMFGPTIPEGWTLTRYAVVDNEMRVYWPTQKWHVRSDLKTASREYVEHGVNGHYLICEIERGDFSIYCEWDTDAANHFRDWTEWRGDNSKPFDFQSLTASGEASS